MLMWKRHNVDLTMTRKLFEEGSLIDYIHTTRMLQEGANWTDDV